MIGFLKMLVMNDMTQGKKQSIDVKFYEDKDNSKIKRREVEFYLICSIVNLM